MPLRQDTGTGGEADRDDRREQLRGQPHSDRQGEQKRLQQRTAQNHVDNENQDRHDEGYGRQQLREFPQANLEPGFWWPAGEPRRDLAKTGRGAGAHHDPSSRALLDDRAHEHARRQVGICPPGDRCHVLAHRQGLAGQHALIAFQLLRLKQPDVGRHDVADTQRHHVAGHQLRDVDVPLVPVPPDHGLTPDPLVQLLHRHGGAVLVDKAEPHAQRHDDRDDDGIGGIAGQAGNPGRRQQQEQQGVTELAPEHGQGTHPVQANDVGPISPEPAGRFGGGQAGVAAAEPFQHLLRRGSGGGGQVNSGAGRNGVSAAAHRGLLGAAFGSGDSCPSCFPPHAHSGTAADTTAIT
jgi:hypothetical protein